MIDLNDKFLCSEVFTYLDMSGFNIKKTIEFLKGKPNESVLAGGAVANSIMNLEAGNFRYKLDTYKVNDLDVFVLNKDKYNWKNVLEQVQSKPDVTDDYLQIASPKLYMVGRDKKDEMDIVHMQLDYRYAGLNYDTGEYETLIKNFPQYVLNSFDLNCVEVGIYYDGEEFKLIYNPTFEKFMKTKKVEVTNVHSEVTLLRAIKKADDLECYVDVEEEFDIIWYGCNSRYLNTMTNSQIEKHENYISVYEKELFALRKSQPLHDQVYKFFFNTPIMGNRRDKIKLLRYFRDENNKNFFCHPPIFDLYNIIILATKYDGELSEFFGQEDSRKINTYFGVARIGVRKVEDYILEKGMSNLIGKTIAECLEYIED